MAPARSVVVAVSICLLLSSVHSAFAVDVTFNGFATLGITSAQHDYLKYRSALVNKPREGLSFTSDSVLGGQVNAVFDKQLEAVGQIVIQDREDTDLINYVEKAFVRYKASRAWAFRAGRMDSNFYMLSDYRTVGYAYPWARPPLDFYSSSSVAAVTDGIDAQYTFDLADGVAKLSLIVGESKVKLIDQGEPFRIDFEDLMAFNFEYQLADFQFKGTYAVATMSDFERTGFDEFIATFKAIPPSLWPQATEIIDAFEPNGDRARFVSAGFKFDNSQWQIQGEVASFQADWILYPNARFGYLSIGYYWQEFMPFLIIAANRPDDAHQPITAPILPPEIPPVIAQSINLVAQLAENSASNQFVDQNTISAGLRWDFTDNWVMKLQVDHMRLKSPGSGLLGNNDPNLPATPFQLNVVHLGFSTIF